MTQVDSAGNQYMDVGNVRVTLVFAKDRAAEKEWAGAPVIRIQAYRNEKDRALCPGAEYPIAKDKDLEELAWAILSLGFEALRQSGGTTTEVDRG